MNDIEAMNQFTQNDIFEYYVALQEYDKKPVNGWNTDTTVQHKDPSYFGNMNYTGILKREFVSYDFDTKEDSEIILNIIKDKQLNCWVLQTENGIHVIFKKYNLDMVGSGKTLNYLGVKCEILVNKHEPLRLIRERGGQQIERKWIYQTDTIEVRPWYFDKFTKAKGERAFDLVEARTCDERNNYLYKYSASLQARQFDERTLTKEEIIEHLLTINKFCFSTPLNENDEVFITALRSTSFGNIQPISKKGIKPKHGEIAQFMLDNYRIVDIGIEETPTLAIYIPEERTYSSSIYKIEQKIIEHFDVWELSEYERKEVIKYMLLKIREKTNYSDPRYIGLKDCVLDIKSMQQVPYDNSFIFQTRLNYEYDPDAYCQYVEDFLEIITCGDKEIRNRLEEVLGASIYRSHLHQSGFIFFNENGSNGKGTFCKVINKLVDNGCSTVDLHELGGFNTGKAVNKTVNITDELGQTMLPNTRLIKSITGGERTTIRNIYSAPIEVEWITTLICNGNHVPKSDDKTLAWHRRWVIIPFNAVVGKGHTNYDPRIADKITTEEAMTYWLKLAVIGLNRALETGDFSECKASDEANNEYKIKNDSTLSFIEDEEPKIENEAVQDIFEKYLKWCGNNGERPVKKDTMSKTIKREFGFISTPQYVDGKTIRVYKSA